MVNHETMLPKISRMIVRHLQNCYSEPNNDITMT